MFVIVFYVPREDCENVKNAMFTAGAGQIGNYTHCAWQTLGQGQFKPLEGSRPAIGKTDKLEKLDEYRVEMVCEKVHLETAIEALIRHHPYEEVAYHFYEGGKLEKSKAVETA
jgi:structural hemagglutinin/hemolysin toxin protein RtxA